MRRVRLVMALIVIMLLASAFVPRGESQPVTGENLGWQKDNFEENVNLTYSPKIPTPMEPVVLRIESRNPRVIIQVAYVYMTVQIPNMGAVTTGLTFARVNETVMTCTFSAYPNATLVRFYVNALDSYNVPAISGNFTYTVMGQDRPGGWVHSQFSKNVNMTWKPLIPNATEPARVTIFSEDGVTIYGAYLYVTYEIKVGQPQSGGFPFQRINQTAMWCDVPGYPMGTNVRFWVTAWDKYNNLTISGYSNYTVPREEDYSNHPFAEFDGIGTVAGLIAFAAVGAYAYMRVLDAEKRRRDKGTSYGKIELKKMQDAREKADGIAVKGGKSPKPWVEPAAKPATAKPTVEKTKPAEKPKEVKK